jgi:uncharacterized membrane protein
VAVLLCALLLAAPAAAQEVSTSSTLSTTSTTRPRLTTTSIERSEDGGRGGLSTGNKVALLIGGLVVLAVALTVFTWRYWRATKPPRASVAAGKSAPSV